MEEIESPKIINQFRRRGHRYRLFNKRESFERLSLEIFIQTNTSRVHASQSNSNGTSRKSLKQEKTWVDRDIIQWYLEPYHSIILNSFWRSKAVRNNSTLAVVTILFKELIGTKLHPEIFDANLKKRWAALPPWTPKPKQCDLNLNSITLIHENQFPSKALAHRLLVAGIPSFIIYLEHEGGRSS